jgi:hypothetical protein
MVIVMFFCVSAHDVWFASTQSTSTDAAAADDDDDDDKIAISLSAHHHQSAAATEIKACTCGNNCKRCKSGVST